MTASWPLLPVNRSFRAIVPALRGYCCLTVVDRALPLQVVHHVALNSCELFQAEAPEHNRNMIPERSVFALDIAPALPFHGDAADRLSLWETPPDENLAVG